MRRKMNVIELRFQTDGRLNVVTVSSEGLEEYRALLSFYQHDDRISEIVVRNLRTMHQETVYARTEHGWTRSCR
jgi:hypothetical protein